MTIQDVYIQTLNKVNKNLNNNNLTLDKHRFILMYKELAPKLINSILIHDNNDEGLNSIQEFLIPNTLLVKAEDLEDRTTFELPENYLQRSSVFCNVVKGDCKDKVFLWEIKDKNYTEKLSDNYNKPSFDFREAPYIVADNKIQIFKDFEVKETVLTYYRYPKEVDIEGYIKSDGTNSVNINPDGGKIFIDKVTSLIAESYAINFEYQQKFQLEQKRLLN